MGLRFHPDGNKVLATWRERCSPSQEDQDLVVTVIRDVAAGRCTRWYTVSDVSDETVTIIEPREGLTVHVRLYGNDPYQFELVRILPITTIEPSDLDARDS